MKMELDDLVKIMKAFGESDLSELKYSDGTETIRLSRTCPVPDGKNDDSLTVHTSDVGQNQGEKAGIPVSGRSAASVPETTGKKETGTPVLVPLAGIFYRSPKPGAEPYTKEGKAVKKGETVGLIEAMKMMSEIPSPCDGIVREIRVHDGEFAEYGRTLMILDEKA